MTTQVGQAQLELLLLFVCRQKRIAYAQAALRLTTAGNDTNTD
jgi:hypothetical protein